MIIELPVIMNALAGHSKVAYDFPCNSFLFYQLILRLIVFLFHV